MLENFLCQPVFTVVISQTLDGKSGGPNYKFLSTPLLEVQGDITGFACHAKSIGFDIRALQRLDSIVDCSL
jgi:hypothetical protein